MSDTDRTPAPSRGTSLWRGFLKRCPKCGLGSVFARYLKPTAACRVCAEDYSRIRADDFPPYLTIVAVGHIVVPLIRIAEDRWSPPAWLHLAVALPLTVALMFWFLPRFKGLAVAWMWLLGLSGDENQGADAGD